VYMQTEVGALRSIGRNEVITVLTRKSSDFALVSIWPHSGVLGLVIALN